MKTFVLCGDVLMAGRVSVRAATLDDAIQKARDGDFYLEEFHTKPAGFTWNGDEDTVEIEENGK